MTVPDPDEAGYLIVDRWRAGDADLRVIDTVLAGMERRGWRRTTDADGLVVLVGPRSSLAVQRVGARHHLIGSWRGKEAPLSTIIARDGRTPDIAVSAVRAGWGRYILVWRDEAGRLVLLRDPTGALDCVWWRCGGAVLAASEPPRLADALLPRDLAIDWAVLGEIAASPELLGDRLALQGLTAVNPGAVSVISASSESAPVWRPTAFCREDRWDGSQQGLVAVVDRTIASLTTPHLRLFAELSGGLDSAIAVGGLVAAGHRTRGTFVNFYGDRPEGDERRYARAAADHLGLSVRPQRKPIKPITLSQLQPLGASVRPALQGVDVAYDADVARGMTGSGSTALLTGQGGDAMFFQAPDLSVVVDRRRRAGLLGLRPGFVAAVGRWTRHSAWTVAARALRPQASTLDTAGRRHPWLEGEDDLPPAKGRQLRQFVNAQLFWGDCLRARAGELLHPFLSQPVVEHCLAIPADQLVAGGRDRGLARRAFASRLPAMVANRRDKGDLSYFYGQVTRASLPMLKPLLLDGLQVRHGLLDRRALEHDLLEEQLIRNPTYNVLLVSAVLEVWAQSWTRRIGEIRSAQMAVEPV